MPVYDYECAVCGVFSAQRPMAECTEPCDCPNCAAPAPRAFLIAPAITGMNSARRKAMETNERSAHAPKHSKSLAHAPDCGCCTGRGKKSRAATSPSGAKSFPKARPWMISH